LETRSSKIHVSRRWDRDGVERGDRMPNLSMVDSADRLRVGGLGGANLWGTGRTTTHDHETPHRLFLLNFLVVASTLRY
jgi:hypothetical protein